MSEHLTAEYLLNPTHRVTVNLIGCGGTGSQVLSGLGRLHMALTGIGHPGLFVRVFDGDGVDETNIGRQLYSPGDVGANKAVLSVGRVNRYFGTDWEGVPEHYGKGVKKDKTANVTISCVDSARARVEIGRLLALKRQEKVQRGEPNTWLYYWMDYGNGHKTGQVVLGGLGFNYLPTVLEKFPQLKKPGRGNGRKSAENEGPSCSIAQALGKQDLYVNSTLAQLGLNILWKLFREGRLSYHGCYMNLDTMCVNPIRI